MTGGPVEEEADVDAGDAVADSWDNLADDLVAVDPVHIAHEKDEKDVIVPDDLGEFQVQRGLPEPITPSRQA